MPGTLGQNIVTPTGHMPSLKRILMGPPNRERQGTPRIQQEYKGTMLTPVVYVTFLVYSYKFLLYSWVFGVPMNIPLFSSFEPNPKNAARRAAKVHTSCTPFSLALFLWLSLPLSASFLFLSFPFLSIPFLSIPFLSFLSVCISFYYSWFCFPSLSFSVSCSGACRRFGISCCWYECLPGQPGRNSRCATSKAGTWTCSSET